MSSEAQIAKKAGKVISSVITRLRTQHGEIERLLANEIDRILTDDIENAEERALVRDVRKETTLQAMRLLDDIQAALAFLDPESHGKKHSSSTTKDAPLVGVLRKGQKVRIIENGAAVNSGIVNGYCELKETYAVLTAEGTSMHLKLPQIQQVVEGACARCLEKRPELNGLACTILMYVAQTGRYEVQFNDGKIVQLKAVNLMFPTGARVQVQDLVQPQYCGQWGQVESFDQESGRYIVNLGSGKAIGVKPENCRV